MNISWRRFNLYFVAAVAAIATLGCQSSSPDKSKKKLFSTFRVHMEASRDSAQPTQVVPIYRLKPVMVRVENLPTLDEGHVASAKVVEVMGGFALQIQFDHRGTILLEECTTLNRPRRMAIFSQFGEELKQQRWLGAPLSKGRIGDGVLSFTPDATREEAEQIAAGLNNVVKKVKTWVEK